MAGFDINDRSTWAWPAGYPDDSSGEYRLNPSDPGAFYQFSEGALQFRACPPGTVFDPTVNTCVLPNHQTATTTYNWLVENGIITDQR